MSFEEELKTIIHDGRAEHENFDSDWRELQTGVVFERLSIAAKVFNEEYGNGESTILDGAVELTAEYRSYVYRLKFQSDKERLQIVCVSNIQNEPERRFTLTGLSAEVDGEIRNFARLMARGQPGDRQYIPWTR